MSLDDASLTSDTGQVAGALGPRQPVEVRFQRLANLDLATVKQPPEVLGLPHVGVQRDEKTRDLGSVTHRYTKSPTGNSCHVHRQSSHGCYRDPGKGAHQAPATPTDAG
jgi:hypothetical protein